MIASYKLSQSGASVRVGNRFYKHGSEHVKYEQTLLVMEAAQGPSAGL